MVTSVRSFEHVQTKRISFDTERIHRMRNGREMHANRHERTENVTVHYASVSSIRDFYIRALIRLETALFTLPPAKEHLLLSYQDVCTSGNGHSHRRRQMETI